MTLHFLIGFDNLHIPKCIGDKSPMRNSAAHFWGQRNLGRSTAVGLLIEIKPVDSQKTRLKRMLSCPIVPYAA